MASLPVYDSAGKEVGKYEISPEDISATINKQLLHDVVVMYQASVLVKERTKQKAVRRSCRVLARRCIARRVLVTHVPVAARSNIRRGGGHAFARRNRDYSYRMPRKAVRAATRMADRGQDSR